jgi:hypothetical protein
MLNETGGFPDLDGNTTTKGYFSVNLIRPFPNSAMSANIASFIPLTIAILFLASIKNFFVD